MENVTWQAYVFALATLLIIYFLFILIRHTYFKFSRQEDLNILSKYMDNRLRQAIPGQPGKATPETLDVIELIIKSNKLVAELNGLFFGMSVQTPIRQDIIRSMKEFMQKYPSLKGSCLEETVNWQIKRDCKTICSIHLRLEEIRELWEGEEELEQGLQ